MRRNRSRSFALAAMTALALACLSRMAVADEPLRVGNLVPTSFSFLPLQVGIEKGLFKKHGLDVTRIDFPRGAASGHQALAAGSVDMVAGGGVEMGFIVKGAPELAVAVITERPNSVTLTVRNDDSIKTMADLKGRPVGISTTGGLSYWLVREVSRRQGWGPDGIKALAIGAMTAQVAALKTKQIDAGVIDLATAFQLEETNDGRILLKFGDVIDSFINQVSFASTDLLKRQPDSVRRYLAGWFETITWIRANKAETVAIAVREFGISPTVAAKSYDGVVPSYSTDGRFPPEAIKTLARSMVETGVLPTEPDMAKLYTEQYLPAAGR
jgi:NitT/TauT family transport system substrate-binding protein